MTAPCKDCTDRYSLCHMYCKKYKAYQAEREEIRKRKAEIASLREHQSVRFDQMERERILKRKRRGK